MSKNVERVREPVLWIPRDRLSKESRPHKFKSKETSKPDVVAGAGRGE